MTNFKRPKYTPVTRDGFLLDIPQPRKEPKSQFLLALEERQKVPQLPYPSTVRYLSNPRK